jgi:hypothetical protein
MPSPPHNTKQKDHLRGRIPGPLDPEDCTLQEAKTQQAHGFAITSITSLDERVPTPLMETATAAKRPRGRPKVTGHPPPDTRCRVQFAPSPQGTFHIRTIKGGAAALDAFLLTENTRPPEPPHGIRNPQGPTLGTAPARNWLHPARSGDYLHPHHKGPRIDGNPPPRRPDQSAVRTHTSSISSRRKVTPTETLSPGKDPTSPSYPHHPLETHWERT